MNLPMPIKTYQYPVVGRREDGSTVFYTGKAGQEFISQNASKAVAYLYLHEAQRRALMLNKMQFGIRFFAAQNLPTIKALESYL